MKSFVPGFDEEPEFNDLRAELINTQPWEAAQTLQAPEHGRVRAQLMNPMWKVVADERLPGTFRGDYDDLRWYCLDQALVSEDLFDRGPSPVIMETIMQRSLLDTNREPIFEEMPKWEKFTSSTIIYP